MIKSNNLDYQQAALINHFKRLSKVFPHQFWLIFVGMFFSTVGASMVWPFMTIYMSQKLNISLTTVGWLMMLNSILSLVFAFAAGGLADKIGRKWIIVSGLAVNALGYLFMGQANSLIEVIIFFGIFGGFGTIYRVGADAMVADLIPENFRAEAYAVLRLSQNVGVAMGPAIGGFLAGISYSIAFIAGASGLAIFSILSLIFARETLPKSGLPAHERPAGGYGPIFRDVHFLVFILFMTIISLAPSLIWTLMAVYAKTQYMIPESKFGFIPTANALMVVFLQVPITNLVKRFHPLFSSALGAFFFTIGVLSVAFAQNFYGFLISMIIATIGELIIMPTSTNYTAFLSPLNMRGRYMSIYSLTWGIAYGIGPLLGGYMYDQVSPVSVWYIGGLIGFISVLGFLGMFYRKTRQALT